MQIFNFWKQYNNKQRIIFIILCFFFFLTSNFIGIRGGYCSSSPCGDEEPLSNSENDHYAELYVKPVLAPTGLLLPPVLNLAGYQTRTDYFVAGPSILLIGVYQKVIFDDKAEQLVSTIPQDRVVDNDISRMRFGYILIQSILLLSLPVWILFSFLIIKFWTKNTIAKIIITLLILWMTLNSLSTKAVAFMGGPSTVQIWEILFRSIVK